MFLQIERIQRICDKLKSQVCPDSVSIAAYEFADFEASRKKDIVWKEFASGTFWDQARFEVPARTWADLPEGVSEYPC